MERTDYVVCDGPLWPTQSILQMIERVTADYILVDMKNIYTYIEPRILDRMISVADDTSAGLLYADHYKRSEKTLTPHPLIPYQRGSLRDDFDFGPFFLLRSDVVKKAVKQLSGDYRYAGLYDLRLAISRLAPIVHVNEYLYTEDDTDQRTSDQRLFDYVNPRNQEVQLEMEKACTAHLKTIGGYLEPHFKPYPIDQGDFPCEASVIIPVRNRVRTIMDAVNSALSQQTSFPYNVIVVDNHSFDKTYKVVRERYDPRLICFRPERKDLGIGGCWSLAASHSSCGRFAVQLDSDDVYSSPHTLQKIVDAFYEQQCPMLIGTYQMTDFDMNPILPGIIAHKEWTPENGRNNALRINGLGAPRAFATSLLRKLDFPNVSYGEDYAMGLRISREYQIGRLYDVLYYCRRWEGNSDAGLKTETQNRYNYYKDSLRTWELEARIKLNNEQ